MPRDAQCPMERRAEPRIKRPSLFPDLHKNILDDFFGFACVTEDADGDGKERRSSLIIERGERLQVPRGDAPEQLRLGGLSLFSFQHIFHILHAVIGPCRIGASQSAVSSAWPLA